MPTPALLLSHLTWVGIAKEVTQGTPISPTIWVPCTVFKPDDVPMYVDDDSMAGNSTRVRGVYLGEQDSTIAMDGLLYPEIVGPLLVATGYADVITGAGPYLHTFKIPAAGTQPPSYTFTYYSGVGAANARQYPGCVMDQLDIIWDAKGVAKYTSIWKGWPSVTIAKPTPAFATTTPLMGWEVAPTVGGSANAKMISASMTTKRSTTAAHTLNNTRSPYNVFAGEVEAAWKIKMIALDEVDWLHIINNDQPALQLVATSPYGGTPPILTFIHGAAAWVKAPMDLTQKWVELDADITGFYNTADAGPEQFTLSNGVAVAY